MGTKQSIALVKVCRPEPEHCTSLKVDFMNQIVHIRIKGIGQLSLEAMPDASVRCKSGTVLRSTSAGLSNLVYQLGDSQSLTSVIHAMVPGHTFQFLGDSNRYA